MSTAERRASERQALPPLVDGERLDRAEFHRRYEAMPPETLAELIGGVVYIMSSPVGRPHGLFAANAITWLGLYRARTPGVEVLDSATTALDDQGEPQPDAVLRIRPERGGQSRDDGEYIAGAPELVLEVADSSRSVDLGAKLADYQRAGVLEYVAVVLKPTGIHWHVRQDNQLVRVPPDADGLYRSRTFPGLWLDPGPLLTGDLAGVLAALERGLATPEHAAFVARLAGAGERG